MARAILLFGAMALDVVLRVNAYGKRKVERLRKRYGLQPFAPAYAEYGEAHDYLHTVLGIPPGKPGILCANEQKVQAYEEALTSGQLPLPKGLW